MSTSTIVTGQYDDVCNALRDVHDEASLWHLSDELVKIAPSGVDSVVKVVNEAKNRGIPTKSANTLRLYRDVAIRFPQSERVDLVSFSAHREALGGTNDVKQARKILQDLAAKHGAAGVTVTTVKKAIGVATGKPIATTAAKPTTAQQTSYLAVGTDLCRGATTFLRELDAMLASDAVKLDTLHAGLTKVLAEVETRRAKAARKAAAAKAKPVNPATSPAARKAIAAANKSRPTAASSRPTGKPSSKARGDLRGL